MGKALQALFEINADVADAGELDGPWAYC